MNGDQRDFNVVRAAVYLLRSMRQRPSADKVQRILQAAGGHGMRRKTLCQMMRAVIEGNSGNRSGTEAEPHVATRELIPSTTGTAGRRTGTAAEHHARVETRDKRNKTLASLAPSAREAKNLIRWVLREGIASGAIPPDRATDLERWVKRESVADARALLATYPITTIHRQARRLCAAVSERQIRRPVSCTTLRACWDWRALTIYAGDEMGGAVRAARAKADPDDLMGWMADIDVTPRPAPSKSDAGAMLGFLAHRDYTKIPPVESRS